MIPAWENGVLKPLEKLSVHQRGLRHQAISVFVNDGAYTLLQRRALGKYHTPGLWSNACCTHPHWQEDTMLCAKRRLVEELGIGLDNLVFDRHVLYRTEVGNGLIEHEEVDIFTAQMPATQAFTHNPDEVMDTRWITFAGLRDEIAANPDTFTPWLRIYLSEHMLD